MRLEGRGVFQMMSKHLYKQYLRLISKWPKDAFKTPERDFANFLSKDVDRQFKAAQNSGIAIDAALCEKRLNALQQLLNNEVIQKYPHKYTSGVFGLKLHDLQKASSEESRKQIGLKPKEGIFKRVFRAIVPEKKN